MAQELIIYTTTLSYYPFSKRGFLMPFQKSQQAVALVLT